MQVELSGSINNARHTETQNVNSTVSVPPIDFDLCGGPVKYLATIY